MTTGLVQDRNLEKQIEKQMGCMAGFLQIFDRHQLLNGKRIYSTKRLPPATDSSSESEQTSPSPAVCTELGKPQQTRSAPSPDRSMKQSPKYDIRPPVPEVETPVENPTKSPLPLSVFEFKEGTRTAWKFSREAPRLSLDSRAVVDAKGSLYPREIRTNAAILSANRSENCADGGGEENDKQRRSPSVIARLMGLEPLAAPNPEPVKKSELRRSASESRVSRDLFQSRFVEGNNFQQKQQNQCQTISSNAVIAREDRISNAKSVDSKVRPEPTKSQNRGLGQRKSFFDSQDVFPEPKQSVSIYGEIERRLRMRGIDEPSKDLETLKQILEALQLKGLLHSGKPSSHSSNQRTLVYDRSYDSPIVLMRPSRSNSSRTSYDSPPSSSRSRDRPRRNLNQSPEPARRDRNVRNQARGWSPNPPSPTRIESNVKSPNRRRPLNIETQRKVNDSPEQRRASLSPVHSPKVTPRRTATDQTVTNRSPRNRKPTAKIQRDVFVPAEDESSSISESSISTPSQTDTERYRGEECKELKEGRSLLERCDKLLLSIAEITATELQPSPVSVLDSSFYKEESSPSPVKMRSIDFKEHSIEFDDDWPPATSLGEENTEDVDLVYISEIFRALTYLPEESDIYLVLEKQYFLRGKDTSKASKVHRKLVFDTTTEILDRKRQLPPWKAISGANCGTENPTLVQTWSEFKRIRERDACEEDLFEVICGVLRKDLAGDAVAGWGDCPIEMSEAVLDIERMVFKDLIGETIRDLAGNCNNAMGLRRKLVF